MIAPYIFQRCVVCRGRFKVGIRPPTWWIIGFRESGDFRIGPPGVGLCWFHPARPLTMPESKALHSNPEFASWRERGSRLAWSLGRVLTPTPKYYRRPGEPKAPAKRQARKVSGRRRSMWGPVYITSTPPLWPLRR